MDGPPSMVPAGVIPSVPGSPASTGIAAGDRQSPARSPGAGDNELTRAVDLMLTSGRPHMHDPACDWATDHSLVRSWSELLNHDVSVRHLRGAHRGYTGADGDHARSGLPCEDV